MKFFLFAAVIVACAALSPCPPPVSRRHATFAIIAAPVAAAFLPSAVQAKSFDGSAYKPVLKDVAPLRSFGTSLTSLKTKLGSSDASALSQCIVGLEIFAKEPDFYPTFARNFVLKSGVNTGADEDSRVIAIKKARDLILATKDVIDADGDRTVDANYDSKKAVSMVTEAQKNVGLFLFGSNVSDPAVASFLDSLTQK